MAAEGKGLGPVDAESKQVVGRGKNYTHAELKQLCVSFLHISQDPAVGNGQRAERFWDRVGEHYNHHRPSKGEVRGRKSLEGKWANIKHDVAKFIGCYNQIEERLTSGTNEQDTLQTAKELYRENHPKGKNFAYECAWTILRDCPRWHSPVDDMARTKHAVKVKKSRPSSTTKDGENGEPEIISLSDQEVDGGTNSTAGALRRPMGNKRAKEENKRARLTEDVLRITAEAQQEQATATKDMAKANFMRARTMENNSTIALLSLPIGSFSPELQRFMSSWKLEEAIKLKQQMQHSSGDANSPPIPNPVPETPKNPLPFVRQPVFPMPVPIPPTMDQQAASEVHASIRQEAEVVRAPQNQNVESGRAGVPSVTLDEEEADADFMNSLNQIG